MSRILIKKFKHYSVFKVPISSFETVDHVTVLNRVKNYNAKIQQAKEGFKNPKIKDKTRDELRHHIRCLREEKQEYIFKYGKPKFQYEFVHYKTGASVKTSYLNKDALETLKIKIRSKRDKLKKSIDSDYVRTHRRIFGDSITLGGIHLKPGEITFLATAKKIYDLSLPKKPKDMYHYLGIEFEFTSKVDRNALGLLLLNAGLAPFCELKSDGSLRPQDDENGYEIAMLVKESGYFQPLKKLCEIFQKINAQVEERRCGLHVHIDVRRRKKEFVYHNLVSCQSLLLKMIPNERRNGEFCARVNSKKFPSNFTGDRRERYKSINAASFYRHGTLEIRMHEGSVNFSDIRNWIMLLVKIANIKTKLPKTVMTIGHLKRSLKVDEKMTVHIRDRINKWNILTPAQPRRPSFDLASQRITTTPSTRPGFREYLNSTTEPLSTVTISNNVSSSSIFNIPITEPPWSNDDSTDPDDIEN